MYIVSAALSVQTALKLRYISDRIKAVLRGSAVEVENAYNVLAVGRTVTTPLQLYVPEHVRL